MEASHKTQRPHMKVGKYEEKKKNDSLFMMNHVFSLSRSVLGLTTLFRFFTFASEYKIFVSSANNTNLRSFDTLHISLMYKMNNLGPSTEPRGICTCT